MKVFVSHAHADKSLARKAVDALSQAGLDVWSDNQIFPGDNWASMHGQALDEAQAMVVLLSPAALQSQEVLSDLSFALSSSRYKGRLVPVITSSRDLDSLRDIPWILNNLSVIDIESSGGAKRAFKKVAARLSRASFAGNI